MSDLKVLNHDPTGAKLEAERATDDVAAYALILGRAEGRRDERAAIVAWLEDSKRGDLAGRYLASFIERGNHLGGDDA